MLKVLTRQPIHILKILAPQMLRKIKQILFWFLKSICFSTPVFTATYQNMKNFVSEILKHSKSGKPDAE